MRTAIRIPLFPLLLLITAAPSVRADPVFCWCIQGGYPNFCVANTGVIFDDTFHGQGGTAVIPARIGPYFSLDAGSNGVGVNGGAGLTAIVFSLKAYASYSFLWMEPATHLRNTSSFGINVSGSYYLVHATLGFYCRVVPFALIPRISIGVGW